MVLSILPTMNIPRDHKPGGAAVTGSRFRPPPGTDRYLSRFVRWDGLSVLSCCADAGSVLPSLNGERPSMAKWRNSLKPFFPVNVTVQR